MDVAHRIRADRKRLGLTQEQLSTAIITAGGTVSASAISYWEKGESTPTPPHLVILARLLGWTDAERDEAMSQIVGVPVRLADDSVRLAE